MNRPPFAYIAFMSLLVAINVFLATGTPTTGPRIDGLNWAAASFLAMLTVTIACHDD